MQEIKQSGKGNIIQDILAYLDNPSNIGTIKDKLGDYQKSVLERDLKKLNDTLLPEIRINPPKQVATTTQHYPQAYLGLGHKTLSKLSLVEAKSENPKEQLQSPFYSSSQNYKDVFANSKQLYRKPGITVTQNSPNLSHILSQSIKSAFLGESKATYPTIIYEGKEPHPLRSFQKGQSFQQTTLASGLRTLGGIKDSLSSIGLENLSLRRKRNLESTSQNFNYLGKQMRSKSNTKIMLPDQPSQPSELLKNPFMRCPSNKK